METPTLTQVRAESPLLTRDFPESEENDGVLTSRVLVASAYVAVLTFRLIAPITESTIPGYVFEEVPEGLTPLAVRAIAIYTERSLTQGEVDFAEATASGQILRSFQAGPYGESYFGPGELKDKTGRPMMDWNTELDGLLWALATQSARDYFIEEATGKVAPASFPANLDWGSGMRGY